MKNLHTLGFSVWRSEANISLEYATYMTWSPASFREIGNTLPAPSSSVKYSVRAVNSLKVMPAVGKIMYSRDEPPDVLGVVSEMVLEPKEEVEVGIMVKVVGSWDFFSSDVGREQILSSSQSLLSPPSPSALSSVGIPSSPMMKGGSGAKSNSDPHPNTEPKIEPDPHPVRLGSACAPPKPAMTIPW